MPYRRAKGSRLRPVPELGTCLAFTRTPPRLHTLNPTAWLIAELCARDDTSDLRAEFIGRSVPPLSAADAEQQLDAGLALLLASGLIVWTDDQGVRE